MKIKQASTTLVWISNLHEEHQHEDSSKHKTSRADTETIMQKLQWWIIGISIALVWKLAWVPIWSSQ
jgi:hypothetical protein